jgi:hypothetical protein
LLAFFALIASGDEDGFPGYCEFSTQFGHSRVAGDLVADGSSKMAGQIGRKNPLSGNNLGFVCIPILNFSVKHPKNNCSYLNVLVG